MKPSYFILIFVLCSSALFGQGIQTDTTSQNTQPERKNSFTSIFYGQPGKAALYSLIIPGGGQVYNKRIWKVPLVYAVEGLAVYNLISNINTFQDRDQCWRSLVENPSSPDPICGTTENVTTAFNSRQSARSQKELAWVFVGAAHLLNIVEAFVDRHLINFDTTEQLTSIEREQMKANYKYQLAGINLFTLRIPLSSY